MEFQETILNRSTKTVYKDNGRTIKLFVENYSKSAILNEAVNQARAEETNINVPELIEVKKIENRWALISKHIEGKPLDKLMEEHPEKMEEYMELFVKTQIEVLNQRAPLMGRIKDKMRRKINEAQNIEGNTKYELLQRLEGLKSKDNVCHGDFNPSNVIIQEDGTVYVIDWAHVTQGNPCFDAARTYMLFIMEGREDLADWYLNLFTSKTDIEKAEVQRCIPIVAASQMSKGKPEEQELLNKWIDVIDFQ